MIRPCSRVLKMTGLELYPNSLSKTTNNILISATLPIFASNAFFKLFST